MEKIFISYAHDDEDFAKKFINWLSSKGFEFWFDRNSIGGGDDWRTEIDEGIQKSALVIVIMSPAAQISEYVTYEWAFALGAQKTVIPILKESVSKLHPRLAFYQHRDFTELKQGSGIWEELADDLRDILHKNNWVKVRAQKTASSAVKSLVPDLNDLSSQKREETVKKLGKTKDKSAIQPLIDTYNQETIAEVRRSIVSALEDMKSKETRDTLFFALRDQDSEVRRRAARALRHVPSSLRELKKISGMETRSDVKKAIKESIEFIQKQKTANSDKSNSKTTAVE